ncbi:hypothetical protein D9M68_742980 [compost metagenome]
MRFGILGRFPDRDSATAHRRKTGLHRFRLPGGNDHVHLAAGPHAQPRTGLRDRLRQRAPSASEDLAGTRGAAGVQRRRPKSAGVPRSHTRLRLRTGPGAAYRRCHRRRRGRAAGRVHRRAGARAARPGWIRALAVGQCLSGRLSHRPGAGAGRGYRDHGARGGQRLRAGCGDTRVRLVVFRVRQAGPG